MTHRPNDFPGSWRTISIEPGEKSGFLPSSAMEHLRSLRPTFGLVREPLSLQEINQKEIKEHAAGW